MEVWKITVFSLSIGGFLGSMLIFQGVLPAVGKLYRHEAFNYGSYTPFQSSQTHCTCSLNISALLESEHIGVNADWNHTFLVQDPVNP